MDKGQQGKKGTAPGKMPKDISMKNKSVADANAKMPAHNAGVRKAGSTGKKS